MQKFFKKGDFATRSDIKLLVLCLTNENKSGRFVGAVIESGKSKKYKRGDFNKFKAKKFTGGNTQVVNITDKRKDAESMIKGLFGALSSALSRDAERSIRRIIVEDKLMLAEAPLDMPADQVLVKIQEENNEFGTWRFATDEEVRKIVKDDPGHNGWPCPKASKERRHWVFIIDGTDIDEIAQKETEEEKEELQEQEQQ